MAPAPLSHHDPATYEDLRAVPDHLMAEIIDGKLIVSPRSAPREARASSALGALLVGPFDFGIGGPGGWWILDEPALHLSTASTVPDLAGWRRERLPALPETPCFELTPDWVCEVLSASTERIDRTRKLDLYRREGVSHVWLVKPLVRTLEVLHLEGDRYCLTAVHAADERVRAEPFDTLELDLSLLWPDAEPDATETPAQEG